MGCGGVKGLESFKSCNRPPPYPSNGHVHGTPVDFREHGLAVDTLNALVESGQHRAYGHIRPSLQELARHVLVLVWDILLRKLFSQRFLNLPDHVRNLLSTKYNHKFICTRGE